MPATDDDTLLPFSLPSICQKKITAAFDGGLILLTEEGQRNVPRTVALLADSE